MWSFFQKQTLRDLSLVLAILMLVASLPSNAGLVVIPGPSRPMLTINICQPLQSLVRTSNILLARPATVLPDFVLRDVGSTAVNNAVQLIEFRVAPETPPPKLPL
jgi:hypothetical protein